MIRHLLAAALLVLAATAEGQTTERIVWGDVTAVRPLAETVVQLPAEECDSAKPDTSEGLATLLAWDLRADCARRERSRVTGYHVEYSWDGRHYSLTMKDHPGKRIPLLLRLR